MSIEASADGLYETIRIISAATAQETRDHEYDEEKLFTPENNTIINRVLHTFLASHRLKFFEIIGYYLEITPETIFNNWAKYSAHQSVKDVRKLMYILLKCRILDQKSFKSGDERSNVWELNLIQWHKQLDWAKKILAETLTTNIKTMSESCWFKCSENCSDNYYTYEQMIENNNECKNSHQLVLANTDDLISQYQDHLGFLNTLEVPAVIEPHRKPIVKASRRSRITRSEATAVSPIGALAFSGWNDLAIAFFNRSSDAITLTLPSYTSSFNNEFSHQPSEVLAITTDSSNELYAKAKMRMQLTEKTPLILDITDDIHEEIVTRVSEVPATLSQPSHNTNASATPENLSDTHDIPVIPPVPSTQPTLPVRDDIVIIADRQMQERLRVKEIFTQIRLAHRGVPLSMDQIVQEGKRIDPNFCELMFKHYIIFCGQFLEDIGSVPITHLLLP